MIEQGEIISYLEMCKEENSALQRGMNFHLNGNTSVILMSLRQGAPYADRVEENGKILIYEGHDIPSTRSGPDPKTVDQPLETPTGRLSQNGLFFQAARRFAEGKAPAEVVKVYEKLRAGIWVYSGMFHLTDAYEEASGTRKVVKFRLELIDEPTAINSIASTSGDDLTHSRIIPTSVKLEVWKRDKGECVTCGSQDNLHFDHIIPYSKGGSSLVAENIQLLCARHNLLKKDHIE